LLITLKTTRGKTNEDSKGENLYTLEVAGGFLDKICGWESVVTVPQAELMANIPFSSL
jgi:hypothetical protein